MMNENLEKFNNLWNHVNRFWETSECMLEIKKVLIDFFSKKPLDLRPLIVFSERIAKHVEFEHFREHEPVHRVEGEWHITNSDLEFWGNICLFGSRDYFTKRWNWLSGAISDAIHRKRRWQTLQRYYDNDGLTVDHKKLLKRLNWDLSFWRGGVSLYVQGKRPFGNSDIEGDMIEILGWEIDPEADEIPIELEEKCWEIFDELQFAIFDVLSESDGKQCRAAGVPFFDKTKKNWIAREFPKQQYATCPKAKDFKGK